MEKRKWSPLMLEWLNGEESSSFFGPSRFEIYQRLLNIKSIELEHGHFMKSGYSISPSVLVDLERFLIIAILFFEEHV